MVALPPHLQEYVEQRARELGIGQSAVVREAVERLRANAEQPSGQVPAAPPATFTEDDRRLFLHENSKVDLSADELSTHMLRALGEV